MSVRVYLPVNGADLAGLVGTGVLPGPRPGHAVTAALWRALREEWPEAGQEEAEYAALAAAAAVSGAAGDPAGAPSRLVLAADVASVTEGSGEDDPTRVQVPDRVELAQVAALHADAGGSADPDDELGWYATQEIASLVADRGL